MLAVYSGATDKGVKEFDKANTAATALGTGEVTSDTLIKVNIYIYIDGTNAAIFTDNAANLDTANIEITFKAKV